VTLRHLALDQITESELQKLIDGKTAETRDIEYKRETYGNADKDYGEFLADVSSLRTPLVVKSLSACLLFKAFQLDSHLYKLTATQR
jgi:hypothetical protein